ncbi:hypothetical protein [Vibrio alginolyticus]|uniref:hypothetical protein n=1 Tax=Vibrio alginolyticus TaxID=663 RepID=UPI001C3CB0DC|nr:hypothetical protein [Vibrio alginolyticus]WGL39770.1 hypothetical protein PG288_90 [Vibrio phage PG288]
MRIICKMFGHDTPWKTPANVSPMWTPKQVSQDILSGEVRVIDPIYTGYMFQGYEGVCSRCGQTVPVYADNVPIIEPSLVPTDDEEPLDLNREHRQLYLFWCDVTKKHADARLYLTGKQIKYLWRCIYKITKDNHNLSPTESDTCNSIVFSYWRAKKRGNK